MKIAYGPSLANGSKPFHAVFGSDDELLELTNKRLTESVIDSIPMRPEALI